MLKYFTTKNIENTRYEISVLKNKGVNLLEDKMVKNVENIIDYSKKFSRVYILLEILYLFTNEFKEVYRKNRTIIEFSSSNMLRKLAFIYLRVNVVWILTNFMTNLYIEKYSNIHKVIKKHKSDKNDFSRYIENKI
jgi:hypothetical protein